MLDRTRMVTSNIAAEAVTRHARGPRAHHPALRFIAVDGTCTTLTFAELDAQSNRFAAVLNDLGIGRGDRVFVACGRRPELHIAAFGTWKAGAVFCPLFTAFGPEPVRQRMQIGEAAALVTTASWYQRRVAPIRDSLPALRVVLCLADEPAGGVPPGTVDLALLIEQASAVDHPVTTSPDDPAIVHFTSGTTGTPKGALHVHGAVASHRSSAAIALDLREEADDEVFWCTADPGWVTGTSYGIIAPLALGITTIVDQAEFDVERWYRILQDQRVTVWYTAPTAIQRMMRVGADVARQFDTSSLRLIASVGEPLPAQAVGWGVEAFGRPIHDNWWQTETGGIMIANVLSRPIRPGSMGKPLPGVEVAILEADDEGTLVRDEAGRVRRLVGPGSPGMLVLQPGWPSMFRAYLNAKERYDSCFVVDQAGHDWYVSGDLASIDEDGYVWFVGRADDVIKTSGHLVGPFEIESVLGEHPAVAASGVFGKPDPTIGAIVKAIVVLRPGVEAGEEIRRELIAYGRRRLGAAVAPREVDFAESLPVTRSGKIMRRLLRARELGLPEGDLSTMEGPP